MQAVCSTQDEWQQFERRLGSYYSPMVRAKSTCKKVQYAVKLMKMFAASPREIDEFVIESIRDYLFSRQCSKVTVKTNLDTIKAILNKAKKMRYLDENPFDVGELTPRVPRNAMARRHAHFSIDDIALVLMKADEDFEKARSPQDRFILGRTRAAAWVFAHVGARSMEVLRARRHRFDGEFLHISHEDALDGRCKSESSDRWVLVPDEARQRLREWLAISDPSEWLFPTERGNGPWVTGGTGYRPCDRIKALGATVGVPGMTISSLRHSFQTHARGRWGFGKDQVELVVGHSNERTQEHYVHVDRDNMRNLMGRVGYF